MVHKQLFDRIKERVTAGVARKVDLEQAAGRLALAEANLLTEVTNLHDVTARLQRLYGELPPETLEAKRLSAKGYGYSQPIVANDPKIGSSVNCRVELIRQEK